MKLLINKDQHGLTPRRGELVMPSPMENQARKKCEPWAVDRYGRLLAGAGTLFFTGMSLIHSVEWIAGTMICALNLTLAALTGRCLIHNVLIKLGAREREDLFRPGGQPR